MKNRNPEILSPGGDFNSAIHALKSGADAVYIGLKSFSARKGAVNFTLEEVRRLKTFCNQNNKLIYVAINTLIKDSELKELASIIKQLELIEIDAIIIQDIGLSKLIKELTSIPIHASTQLAAHNFHSIKTLENLGFTRVVLSRELNIGEIQYLIESFPKMEFEVFIHGALCFGFSGLCLASGKLLSRSANRGSCGQICRTWFNLGEKREYSLSLNDLSLSQKILLLKNIGVSSLKIEGRMKGPGYASTTANLYYNILNNKEFDSIDRSTRVEFSREGDSGYLDGKRGGATTNLNYPGHTGITLGEIEILGSNKFTIKTDIEIDDRDGLMVLDGSKPPKAIKFSARILKRERGTITLQGNIPKNSNTTLYKISKHNRHLKEEKSTSYKPWKSKVPLKIELQEGYILITAGHKNFRYTLELQPANSPVDLNSVFNKIFLVGGDTPFTFPSVIINSSGIKNPFIPGSLLKKIRNKFQEDFLPITEEREEIKIDNCSIPTNTYLKNRAKLPFITNFNSIKIDELLVKENSILLPLAPVIFDSREYLNNLKKFLKEHKEYNFIIGLNNISHISFTKELPEGLEYYGDYGLYNTNEYSKEVYSESINRLKWLTEWVEDKNNREMSDYPPLFISRTCPISQKRECPSNCDKKYNYTMKQNRNIYRVIVENCLTYIFSESSSLT